MILSSDSYGYEKDRELFDLQVNNNDNTSALLVPRKDFEEDEIVAVLSAHDLRMWASVFLEMARTCERSENERKKSQRT